MFSYFDKQWLKSDDIVQERWKVRNWLEQNGWGRYVAEFHAQHVHDLNTLRALSADDLKGIGLSKIGDRRKFLSQAQEQPTAEPVTPAPKSPMVSGGSLANLRAARAASVTAKPCGMCDDAPSVVNCVQCEEAFCDECNSEMHASGTFRLHTRTPVGGLASNASHPRLGQNANMVRVLAQRAAQDSKQELLRALGAEEHQVLMSPRGSITPRLSAMMRSPNAGGHTRNSSIARSRLSELTEGDEDADSFALGPSTMSSPTALGSGLQSLRSRHSANDINLGSTTPAPAPATTETFESVLAAAAASHPSPAHPHSATHRGIAEEPSSSDDDLDDLDLDMDMDASLATPVKQLDLRAAHNINNSAANAPFPSPFTSPPQPTPGTPFLSPPRPSRLSIAPALLASASPPDAGQRLTRARGTLGFSPLRSSVVAGAGEVSMTRDAQEVIAKTKLDAAAALQEARKAGEEAARARARADDESREMREAEEEYANRRAVAQVLLRKAKGAAADDEVQAMAKKAEQEAAVALERLELERKQQAEANKAEQAALRLADAALAKQYQATEQMRQINAVAQGVSKPVLRLSPDQVVIRVQAWGWEEGRRRGQAAGGDDDDKIPTHPIACVEVRLDELVRATKEENDHFEAMEDEDDEPATPSNRKKGAETKKTISTPPMTLPSLRRVLAERVHAHITAARAADAAAFRKHHGTCFDYGADPATTSMDTALAAAPPLLITHAHMASLAALPAPALGNPSSSGSSFSIKPVLASTPSAKPSLTSTPSVKPGIKRGPTISIRTPAKSSKPLVPPAATLAAADWRHPLTGDVLDYLETLQGLLPTPTQQLHALRRRPEVYGSADAMEDGARAPGCAGEPLLHALRLDLGECAALWRESQGKYSAAAVKQAEEAKHWDSWITQRKLIVPLDVVLAPTTALALPSSASGAAAPAAKAFKFNWSEHSLQEERDRVLRVCVSCQRYFSDDVNTGSVCMKHAEKKVDLLATVPKKQSPTPSHAHPAPAFPFNDFANRSQLVLHPCCGADPVALPPPPPLTVDGYGPADTAPGFTEDDLVLSDDDAQEDVDLALEVAEEEEDIVGYSTAPSARRVAWAELYAGEEPIGCLSARHEGGFYRPLRLRALTVAEQRVRRAEELKKAKLGALEQQSSLRHRTTIDKLELLGQAMRNAQHAARGGLKAATVCVYRETPGRVDPGTGRRRAPWISFEVPLSEGAPGSDPSRLWSSRVVAPLTTHLRRLQAVPAGDWALHCPWSMVPVADLAALELGLQPDTGTVDLILVASNNKTNSGGNKAGLSAYTGLSPPSAALEAAFPHLRGPADPAAVAAQAAASPHWAQSERGLAVRHCRLCGELFQAVRGPQPAGLGAGEWEAMHTVGCAKYDLTHPPDSKLVWPPTLSLAAARRHQGDRASFAEAWSQRAQAEQIQGLASSLLRAYGAYAVHAHAQAESDSEDEQEWSDGDEEEADAGLLRGHEAEADDEADADAKGGARLTCCLRSEQRMLALAQPQRINQSYTVLNLSQGPATASTPAAAASASGRGWRLLASVPLRQTPRQAAELASVKQQRARAPVLQLRVFAAGEAPGRGSGAAPACTALVRVCAGVGMGVVRYRVLRAWEHERGRGAADWRTDVVLRHPVTGQRFEAVGARDLEAGRAGLRRARAPGARAWAHVHCAEAALREDEAHFADIVTVGEGARAGHARMVWHETPMADVFGPPVCLTDWADAEGRVDVVLCLRDAAARAGHAPEPALAELRVSARGEVEAAAKARFSMEAGLDSYFDAQVVAGRDVKTHPHAWPAELRLCARVCRACGGVFCDAGKSKCGDGKHQGPIAFPLRYFLDQQ